MRADNLVLPLVVFLVTEPGIAAKAQTIDVTWAGFREQVAQQRLTGRGITIFLSDGARVSTTLRGVDEGSVVVDPSSKINKRWRATNGQARIPRAEITSVEFRGRRGRSGMIGGLAGLAIAGALSGAAAASPSEGNAPLAVIALIPILGLVGYFAGHHYDEPLPHFRIVR